MAFLFSFLVVTFYYFNTLKTILTFIIQSTTGSKDNYFKATSEVGGRERTVFHLSKFVLWGNSMKGLHCVSLMADLFIISSK